MVDVEIKKKLNKKNLSCKMVLSLTKNDEVIMEIPEKTSIVQVLTLLTDSLVEVYMQAIEPHSSGDINDFANELAEIVKGTYKIKTEGGNEVQW